ncbi:MAG TPA: hypothetical protein VF184_05870 [Phycisphaeraceae bacterium]
MGHATRWPQRLIAADGEERAWRRRCVERVLELAQHLDKPDRLLLEQVYRHGLSAAELELITGMGRRRLQRRIARLTKRIQQREFRLLTQRAELVPRDCLAVGRRFFLQGRSLRDTVRLTGLTLHQVRQRIRTIRTLAQAIG